MRINTLKFNHFIYIALANLVAITAFATPIALPWRAEDIRQGYVDEINRAKEEPGQPLFLIESPYANKISFRDKVFNEKLSKEFTKRYKEQFGRTQAEAFFSNKSFNSVQTNNGSEITEEEFVDRQSKFGNYMMRRLVEYHLENQAKTNPATKKAWETKEKIQRVKIQISEDIKFKSKYDISANDLRAEVINPYFDFEVLLVMDEAKIGPADIDRTVVSIGKKVTKTLRLDSHVTIEQESVLFIASKSLRGGISLSLTGSPNYISHTGGGYFGGAKKSENDRDRMVLGGLGMNF